jgi:hypothetical protein
MTSSTNVLSRESILTTEIKNKGFAILDTLFKEHGWHLVKNEMNWICYTKFGQETDTFDIRIDPKMVHVSIPIKNSPFQYTTSFKDYFQASEYVEARLLDFIDKKN